MEKRRNGLVVGLVLVLLFTAFAGTSMYSAEDDQCKITYGVKIVNPAFIEIKKKGYQPLKVLSGFSIRNPYKYVVLVKAKFNNGDISAEETGYGKNEGTDYKDTLVSVDTSKKYKSVDEIPFSTRTCGE